MNEELIMSEEPEQAKEATEDGMGTIEVSINDQLAIDCLTVAYYCSIDCTGEQSTIREESIREAQTSTDFKEGNRC